MCYLYKYLSVNKGIQILKERKVFFARTVQFNDPFDGQLLPMSFMRELRDLGYQGNDDEISRHEEFVKDRLNEYGVLSLSKNCENMLMWSHYADSHKGVCLGFKSNLLDDFYNIDWMIRQELVKYEDEHPFRNIHKDWLLKNRFNSKDNFFNYCEMCEALLNAAITVKHSSWGYEQEVRIISDVNGLHFFHNKALDHVILGMNISIEDEMAIKSLLNSEPWDHIRLYRARRGKAVLSIDIGENV